MSDAHGHSLKKKQMGSGKVRGSMAVGRVGRSVCVCVFDAHMGAETCVRISAHTYIFKSTYACVHTYI
jgi:hypothetical protein